METEETKERRRRRQREYAKIKRATMTPEEKRADNARGVERRRRRLDRMTWQDVYEKQERRLAGPSQDIGMDPSQLLSGPQTIPPSEPPWRRAGASLPGGQELLSGGQPSIGEMEGNSVGLRQDYLQHQAPLQPPHYQM